MANRVDGRADDLIALETGCLLGFDQMPKVDAHAADADLTRTARLLTKIGPETPFVDRSVS
ncbi:MAG: hypothetical protein H6883_14910 [Rhodobiaceae bacterium]|nr:hypothetical protein [Rhodobiaceae bacterium]MCC0057410.1 hypothetical protein [Rhodobiaceae bacterium]